VSSGSVRWAEPPDEEREVEAHDAEVDESFAARKLRRWITGMFGGKPLSEEEPPESESDSWSPMQRDDGKPSRHKVVLL
jgi:hypothetical protein